MTLTPALEEALNDAISSGKFIDTKIVLYSRRDSSGRVCKPKALYANSRVLKSVPYFNDLLSGAFSESEIKDFSEDVDEGELAEDYGYSSDSDLEEDWDFASPAPLDSQSQPRRQEALDVQYKEHARMGMVIRVQDVAFITFQAFLLYLYTDLIEFAPFGSKENRKSRSHEIAWGRDGVIPKPSPKSIYRLADKYDVPGLKGTALRRIKDHLHKCDIVQETFSAFTSRYSEIKIIQVNHLVGVWLLGSKEESTAVRKQLEEKVDSYAAGEQGHAADTISLIWEVSNKEGPAPSPSRHTYDLSSWFSWLCDTSARCGAQGPLIKSIQEGCLLDRKYWARRSREGVIEPIYFSSGMARSRFSDRDVLLRHRPGRDSRLYESDEDKYAEDSDYENEPEPTGDPASVDTEVGYEEERGQRLLLGSSVAWRSIFFYLCTEKIRFAPLKSRGLSSRSQWKLKHTGPGLPTPCSPKTIYLLAKRLGLRNLKDLAFKDIEAKLTEENITTEIFSGFAAQHPEIMAMGWEHLGTNLKTERTMASVVELIKGMEGGDAAHRAEPLKFGLYNALRQKGPAETTLALLRCTDEKCSAHKEPISYLDLGRDVGCPKHLPPTRPMKCSECGHARVDHRTWCKGCRMVFK